MELGRENRNEVYTRSYIHLVDLGNKFIRLFGN